MKFHNYIVRYTINSLVSLPWNDIFKKKRKAIQRQEQAAYN
jgi:hypothetical protein